MQGYLDKIRTRGPCIMQKNLYILYQMFLNFFSHASLLLVIFAHAPSPVPSEDCCFSPPKKKAAAGAL